MEHDDGYHFPVAVVGIGKLFSGLLTFSVQHKPPS